MPRNIKTTSGAAGATRKKAARPDREMALRFLSRVPEEFIFWNHDGRVFRDLKDLKDGLAEMSDDVYAYHSNEVKKDFSNWVRDIIGDEQLAKDLENATGREEAARIVEERYNLLISKTG